MARGLIALSACLFAEVLFAAAAQRLPLVSPPSTDTKPLFRAEKREVLVDVIATDHQGCYVTDLRAEDFRVWEDGKEQHIDAFTSTNDAASSGSVGEHYTILFFDMPNLDTGQQVVARAAASKFVSDATRPERSIAILNFGATLHVE